MLCRAMVFGALLALLSPLVALAEPRITFATPGASDDLRDRLAAELALGHGQLALVPVWQFKM